MGRLLPWAAAPVAGALPALAFPEPGAWWLAWVGLVPMLLLVRAAPSARDAGIRGWLAGAGFLLGVHHWLLPSVHVFLPLVVLVMGLLWLPFGRLAWRRLRTPVSAPRLLSAVAVLPAGWLAIELVRSVEYLGGPWGLLGASQWQLPPALSLAGLGGVWLITVAVVAVNVAVTVCIGRVRERAVRRVAVAVAGLVVVGMLGWDALWPGPAVGRTVRVVAVQPGTLSGAEPRLARQEELTLAAADTGADLVVWGESAVAYSLLDRPDLQARLADLSSAVGTPLLVNVDARDADGAIYKTAVVVDEAGVHGSYAKTRLVPFGEYLPLRPALRWVTGLTEAAAEDRRRGEGLEVLTVADAAIGPLVCFESAFPDMARTLAARGAELVVVQSSTWTFQDSWAPEQHASLAAVRAAETGVPVLHATLTGTTAAYDGRGRPLAEPLGTDESGFLVADLPLGSGGTPYVALGPWVPLLAWVTLAVGVLYDVRRRLRLRLRRRPRMRPLTAPAHCDRSVSDLRTQ